MIDQFTDAYVISLPRFMRQKRRSGLGEAAAAKKTKAADGAVPKYLVVNNYERRSTVRTALSKVVKQAPWRDLFRLLSFSHRR